MTKGLSDRVSREPYNLDDTPTFTLISQRGCTAGAHIKRNINIVSHHTYKINNQRI